MEEELKKLGLTGYEVKVYATLLKLGKAKGGEISRRSDVPHGKTYVALTQLVDKGLISVLPVKPKLFQVQNPKTAVKKLLQKKTSELSTTYESFVNSIKEIKLREEKPSIHEKVTVISGFKGMYDKAAEWMDNARSEICILSVGEKIPYSMKVSIVRAVKRGLKVRFIATKFDEENRHILEDFVTFGWEMRHYPAERYTFAVMDKKKVMINVRGPKDPEERISIFFENEGLAKAMADYYESLWKKARPIKF